ncbi:MAG: hypothetical protein L3J47_10645 [Sulfurovum sp.]|nr:hypothetical protein [Sulfurovum sp.]
MELPAITLPNIELPFDIPTLLHPPVDHFAIAIPVLVLIIEIINLFAKKRAIGVISFVLLIIGMAATVAAYFTGVHDGKEAFDALTQAGQAELKEHKLLGTYLVIASAVVVVFKLLSAMVKKGLVKMLYLLILVLFVAGILKQGKDGGELVYEYGANVERVADLDSELFDAKEELDELKEEMKSASEKVTEKVEAVKEAVSEAAQSASEKTSAAVESAQKSADAAVEAVKEKGVEMVEHVKEKAAEIKESIVPSAGETSSPEIEKVPQSPEQPEVATH